MKLHIWKHRESGDLAFMNADGRLVRYWTCYGFNPKTNELEFGWGDKEHVVDTNDWIDTANTMNVLVSS